MDTTGVSACVADLARVLQLDQRADGVLDRHRGVGPVELVERDLVELEPPQAALARLPQVVRMPVDRPLTGPGALQPALGGDHEVVRVRVERLADQLLADVRPVGVGGVDEVDAQLDRAAQHRLRLVPVGRRTPDPVPGDPHGPKPEAVDRQVPADVDRPSFVRVHDPRFWHGPGSRAD
jgi:hypothetical protein